MKHLLKRTLALILSILMVMGTLPMTAWAARIEDDAVPATPVVDGKDGVVDTLAKSGKDDDVTPIDPVDPDPVPVDPSVVDVVIQNVTMTSDGTWSMTFHSDTRANQGTGNWTLLIIPDVCGSSPAVRPSQMRHDTGDAEIKFSTSSNSAMGTLTKLTQSTGMSGSDYLAVTGAALNFDADGNLTIGSGDYGKAPLWDDLQASIGTFTDAAGNKVNTMTTEIPFLFVLYTQGGSPGLAYYDATMEYKNTNFELVADPTSINSAASNNLAFVLRNATAADKASGLATVEAGVPSYVDKITFVGTFANGTDANVEFSSTTHGLIALDNTKSINQTNTPNFRNSTGFITVEYHKDGDPGAKKTLVIPVTPVADGELSATGIAITLRRGETKTAGTTITNRKGSNKYIVTEEGYTDITWESATPELPTPVPGGLTLTLDNSIYTDYSFPDDDTVEYSGTGIAPNAAVTYSNFLTVTAPANAIGSTYTFDVFLNASDEEFSQETIKVPVKVTVVVDQEWTIIYHHNDGATADLSVTEYDGTPVAPYYPSRTGYSFLGWFTEEALTNEFTYPHTFDADYELYAKWEEDAWFTVTFEPGDHGSFAAGDQTSFTSKDDINYSIPTYTADTYYHFTGWVSDPAGKTPADNTPVTENITFTAQWALNTFDVEYHYSGTTPSSVTSPPAKQTGIQAGDGTHNLTKPSDVTGWTWNGWKEGTSTAAGTGSVITTVSKNQTHEKTVHVWGTWTHKEHTLTWNGNGGKWGTDATQTETPKYYGDSIAKKGATGLTRVGYDFLGWAESDSGALVTTWPQTMPDSDKEYFAQWQQKGKVKFLLDGGTWKNSKTDADYQFSGNVGQAPASIPAWNTDFEKTGYSFAGWLKNTEKTTTTPTGNIKFEAGTWGTTDNSWDSATTYTAKWAENTAKVTVMLDTLDAAAANAPSATPGEPKLAPQSGGTAISGTTSSPGVWNFSEVPAGKYDIKIGDDVVGELTAKEGDLAEATVQYYEVKATSSSNGSASMTIAVGGTKSGVSYALKDSTVTWTATPHTYFAWDHWDMDNGTLYSSATLTVGAVDAATEHEAHFERKLGELTINLTENGTTNVKWPTGKTAMMTVAITEPTTSYSETWTTTSDATTTYKDVQQGLTYTVSITEDGTTVTQNVTIGEDNASEDHKKTVALEFDTLTVVATQNPAGAWVGMGTAASPTVTATTVGPKAYLTGAKVYINADPKDSSNSYDFDAWTSTKDGTTGTGSPADDAGTAATSVTVGKETTLTATFTKPRYVAYLKLTLNGTEINALGDDIKGVTLGAKTATPTGSDGLWKVEQVSSTTESNLQWSVTTSAGGPFTKGQGTKDSTTAPAKIELYSVKTADKSAMETSQATMTATGATNKSRVIVELNKSITNITANPAGGYALQGWNVTNANNSEAVAADKTFKLTAAVTDEVILIPTFTFSATINTKLKSGSPTNVTSVKIVNQDDSTDTQTKTTPDTGKTGEYTFSTLKPKATYDIYVNGFKVGNSKTLTTDDITNGQDVTVYKIDVMAHDDSSNTDNAGGTVRIGFSSANTTAVYLPEKASTDATNTVKINVTGVTANYRKRTGTSESDLWTSSATAVALTNPNNDAPTVSVTEIADDVTLTAHFVRQYTTTTEVTGTGITNPKSKATIDGATSKTVDAGTVITVIFAKGEGESLKSWTGENGTFYTDAAGTTTYTPTAADTTVYFKPTGDNAKVKATVEAAKYPVRVEVYLDNVVWGKADGREVELNGTPLKYNAAGYWTEDFYPNDTGTAYAVATNVTVTGSKVTVNDKDKKIQFSAANAEHTDGSGNPDPLNTTVKLYYYTINLAASPVNSGSVNNQVDFASSVKDIAASATGTDKLIVLAKSGTTTPIDVAAKAYDDGNKTHYRYDNWSTKVGTFTGGTTTGGVNSVTGASTAAAVYNLPGENSLKWAGTTAADGEINGTTNQITLTATFIQQFKVTVEKGANADANTQPQVSLKSTTGWNNSYVMVDAESPVYLQVSSTGIGLYFMDWEIKKNDAGVAQGAGQFNKTNASETDKTVGKLKENGTNNPKNLNDFTPTADTTIVLNMWKRASASSEWTYDRGTGKKTSTNTDPLPPIVRWEPNHGETPTKLSIKKRVASGETSPVIDLVKDTDYTVNGNEYRLKFDSDTLKAQTQGIYDVIFTYTLGDDGNSTTTEYNTVSGTTDVGGEHFFTLTASKATLRKVQIGVSTDTAAAYLNEHADAKDQAVYVNHWEKDPNKNEFASTNTIPIDDLEFTWYYTIDAPVQSDMSKDYTATQLKAVTDAATALPASLAEKLTLNSKNILKGTLNVKNTLLETADTGLAKKLQGKNVFAVVKVKDDSEYGEGTVVTNSILVDYDATIIVKQDGNPVTDAKAGGYAVYLWPADDTGTFDRTSDKAIPATHTTAADGANNGVYTTKNSALTANKSYHIYVLETEGMDATKTASYVQLKNGSTAVTYLRTTTTAPVADYYTVTMDAVSTTAGAANGITNATVASGSGSPGENFSSSTTPTFVAATGRGTTITSGKGVLKGSSVTAKVPDLGGSNAGKGWTQDYDLTWMTKATAGGTYTNVTESGSPKVQTSKTAVSTGHGYTTNLGAQLFISGSLKQNTYTLSGVIKDVDGNGSNANGGRLASATLTRKTNDADDKPVFYTWAPSSSNGNGYNNGTVSFTVPRGEYILTSAVETGSTHKGYYYKGVGNTTTDVPAAPQSQQELEELTANATNQYTIYVAKTSLAVLLNDEEGTNKHSIGPVSATDKTYRPDTHVVRDREGVKVVYNYGPIPKTVTVTNKGNTPLTLTPVIERKTKTDTDFVKITTLTAGADDKGVTFAYKTGDVKFTLTDEDAFTLDPEESCEITITIPDTLTTYDNMSYHLDFTSKDGRKGLTNPAKGPTVGYDLKIDIDAVTVGRVTATEQADGSFKVENNWIKEDVKKPISSIVPGDYTSAKAGENLGNTSSWAQLKTPQDAPGTAVAADNDIQYSWYVADWSAQVTLGANGTPTATGGTIKAGQGTVSEDTLTYMPKPEERGMALYLIAKGVNNAQGAAMTPNRTFEEEPIPVPFAGYVRVYQDGAQVSSEAAAGNYKVYLRDMADGETGALIPTTPVADTTNTGKWIHKTADTALLPGHTYEVLVSAAESDGDDHRTKVTGETVTVGDRYARADYYLVTVNPTTLSQGKARYDTVLGQYDDSELFFKTVPQAKPTAVGDLTGKDVTGKHVLKGTKVTFTYNHWNLDYNLNWTDGVSATDTADAIQANATTNAVQTLTYDQTRAAVNTKLVLNLYEVKAYVDGTVGSVSEVTMALTDGAETFTFYAKASDTGDTTTHQVCGLDTPLGAAANIEMSQSVSFWLPATKGDNGYNVTGTPSSNAYKLEGYRATHNPGGATTATLNKTVTANTSLDVVLAGSGSALTVADNVSSTTPPLATNVRDKAQGTASISGATKSEPTVTQTIELNYHYNATQTIQLTISNTSKDEEGNPGAPLTTVTGNFGTVPSWLTIKNNGLATAKTDVPSSGEGSSFTVDLEIADNLDVAGTYTYSPSFTFTNAEGADATVTYTLKVIVNPLPITSLTIKDNAGALQLTDYDDTTKTGGVWVDHDNDNATDPVSMSKVSFDTGDVKYVWVEAPLGRTVTKSDLNMTEDASGNTITATAAAASAGVTVLDTQTSTSYTPAKQGVNYQLVAYRASSTSNAKDFAVSNAVTTTYDGIVYVNVDGARTGETNNAPDPGYKVEFYDGATKVTDGEWRSVATNKYAYVSEDGLTPGKDYTVKVSRTTTDVEATVAEALAKKLTGTSIGTALTNSNVTQVSYFTVHAVKFSAEPYATGTGVEFDYAAGTGGKSTTHTDIAPKIWLDTLDVTDKTVLSGQDVTAKVATAWGEDYTLTWQDNGTGTFTAPADDKTTATASDAVSTGYPHANVDAETFIGGRLDQNTYTIVGTIDAGSYPGSNVQQVTNVTLKSGNVTYYSDSNAGITGTAVNSGVWKDGADGTDNKHNHNDTVTFTVVAGDYTITGYEDVNYTIRKVTVSGGTTGGAKRNVNELQKVEKLEESKRTFTIHLELTADKLGVKDDQAGAAYTVSSPKESKDHEHADNEQTYFYKNITSEDHDFVLSLSNPGNVDLTLGEPKVYRLPADTADYTDIQSVITTSGTELNVNATTGELTAKTGGTPYTAVTITGLSTVKDTELAINAGGDKTGDPAAGKGGTVNVNTAAVNKDDAIYVVMFPSTFKQEGSAAGATPTPGPTVYYILDLTVNPLPLKEVDVARVGATDKLRLDGYDSTDATKTGLDHVHVDEDGQSGTPTLADAKKQELTTTGDISFVWVKSPADKTKADVVPALSLDTTNNKMISSDDDVVEVTTVTDREHTPDFADQGLNFYLVAYRTDANSNVSGFAVSNEFYAQVTVALKAYQTGKTEGLTDVNISTMVGTTKKTSNDDTVVVTGIADDANVLTFDATMTDVTAKGTADDPATAKWYFHHWAANLTGSDPAKDDAGHLADVDPFDRLKQEYTVTGKATVIGYFDRLPFLTGFSGYNIGDNSPGQYDNETARGLRTMTYTHFDGGGAGNVEIIIEAVTGKFKGSNAGATELSLNNVGYFETIANTSALDASAMSKFGGDGKYVLRHDWLRNNLEEGKYIITFYDTEKGVNATSGNSYAGYDKYFELTITAGEKEVTAKVNLAEGEKNPGHEVRLTNDKPTPDLEEGELNDTGSQSGPVDLYTYNGVVNIFAEPAAGYVFTGWTREEGEEDGNFGAKYDADKVKLNDTFAPLKPSRTILANFRKVAYTTSEGHAKIYYGTKAFLDNTDESPNLYKDIGITTADTATVSLTSEWLQGDALKTYLKEKMSMSSEAAEALVDKTTIAANWLTWDAANNKFKVTAAAKGVNVEKKDSADVEDELVVYAKFTEGNSGQDFIIPFTIDIMTSELKIVTANTGKETQAVDDGTAYKTKFIAENTGTDKVAVENGVEYIANGSSIELDKFEFISIDNVNDDLTVPGYDQLIAPAESGSHNAGEDLNDKGEPTSIVTGKGKWEIVTPANKLLNGSGTETPENANEYTFRFVYTGIDEGDGKAADDYNYTSPTITLKIPVKRPDRALLIGDKVSDYDDLQVGDGYSSPWTTGDELPVELDLTPNTHRENESITYLDTEPTYTVNFQRTGTVNEIKLTIEPEVDEETGEPKYHIAGFKLPEQEEMDAIAATLMEEGDLKEDSLKLELAPVKVTDTGREVWVGKHYIRFKLAGKDELGVDVTAYYTLSVTVDPKPITSLDIEIENPGDEAPKKVEGTLEGSDTPTDLTKPDDKHGVTPLKKIEIVPEIGPDGETVIKRTVEVEIDPNYIYSKDDPETPDVTEPEITENTELNGKDKTDGNIDVERKPLPADPEKPDEPEDTDHIVFITQRIPALMFDDVKTDDGPTNPSTDPATTGPKKDDKRGNITITKDSTPTNRYEINLGAYGSSVYGIDVEMLANGLEGATLTPTPTDEENNKWNVGTLTDVKAEPAGDKYTWTLDLSTLNTAAPGTYNIKLHAKGYTYENPFSDAIEADYTITIYIPNPPSPGSPSEPCPCKVFYHIGIHGTTSNPTVEDVSESTRPSKVPTVTAVDGYTFRGWSLTNPATLKKGEQPVLVDPKTVQAKGETMTFYAVIQKTPFHEHYVIGYPDGTFGPGDDINRASVATIIARAILPDFVEGANYGNPGGYSDVSGHWAESAIAYCSKYGVFEGMPDGTFQPNRPITRQEFALVMARLDGVMKAGEMTFTDVDEIASWALDGVYTTYARGWVNGYPDGTFKPMNNIRRDEAVKVFNAYLKRGVDADGLHDLHEYVYPDKNTGNDFDQYKTWPDVPANHWAYYEIIEAANDHAYEADMDGTYKVPETWTKCWINERWGLSTAGADAAMVSAGFQVWFH